MGLISLCITDLRLFCSHFHLLQGIFWFLPWCHCWPICCLITCYLFSISFCILPFSSCDWFLLSLQYGQRICMIWFQYSQIYWDLFCVLTNMWPILENVPCSIEKVVYYAILWCNALKISIKSIWSSMSFKVTVYLEGKYIHCLENISVDVTIFLSLSPFSSIKMCFTFLGAPMLGT